MSEVQPSSIKPFPAAVVLSVYTGRLLCEFAEMHELMDHLYPGIMTIGVAAMQPTASAEMLRQFPALAHLPEFRQPWTRWLRHVATELPASFDVLGPHDVSRGEIQAAFDKFGRGPAETT